MVLFDLPHTLIEIVAFCGIPAYFALQAWTLLALRDSCRFAALLPVLIVISLVASVTEGLSTHGGPSAATLMFFAPAAAGYLAFLIGLSAIIHRLDWRDLTQDFAGH